ncbi:hypothetical protein [Nocardia nepalensis]|uniref:hypothetical protein n=1 Tax=Nocardia nepalensis TaxID=3375448 RepID=UPI003B68054A
MSTTETSSIDAAIATLAKGEKAWGRTALRERRNLLEQLHANTAAHAQRWVDTAASIKGLPADSPLLGEEWSSGPYSLLTGIAALTETMQALEDGRSPLDGYPIPARRHRNVGSCADPAAGMGRRLSRPRGATSYQISAPPVIDGTYPQEGVLPLVFGGRARQHIHVICTGESRHFA